MVDPFGADWASWNPSLLLPYPWQEFVDGFSVLMAVPIWILAGWLGLKARRAYLRASKEWSRLDKEAGRG
jgi:hypothetical protein